MLIVIMLVICLVKILGIILGYVISFLVMSGYNDKRFRGTYLRILNFADCKTKLYLSSFLYLFSHSGCLSFAYEVQINKEIYSSEFFSLSLWRRHLI